jgi:hypothetical protein
VARRHRRISRQHLALRTNSASSTPGHSTMTTTTTPIDRAAINRRNAQKSTEPRTPEGKNRSRFNALKHGMTAKTLVLPDEDADVLQMRVET